MNFITLEILFAPLALTAAMAGAQPLYVIPQPQRIEHSEGEFHLQPVTQILVDTPSRATGMYLAEQLAKPTGYRLRVRNSSKSGLIGGAILLTTKEAKASLGAEGYELTIAPDAVVLRAPAQAGLFYGAQTLLQLFPPEIFATNVRDRADWAVACAQIEDQPRFCWRGLLLDVSRHFFTKAEVKRLLDLMALYKLNTFHWHLVDEDGWRIEIKRYPRLTVVGAWRKHIGFGLEPKASTAYGPDGRYGGFYTQTDIREIVDYAQARHITIVPEIEMPGHSTAALACYPEFGCSSEPYAIDRGPQHRAGVYCAGNEAAFAFLQDVLTEVMEMFPGKYIHIGGDEVPKDNWKACPKCQARMRAEGLRNEDELQSYFVRRMEKFISSHGRSMVGWSEISAGGLATNAVLMHWLGGGLEAASAGHDVVMSPLGFCYFNFYQVADHDCEPRAFGNDTLTLRQVYSFEPIPANLAPENGSRILGAQANLWTEYIGTLPGAEYMLFPRLCALAEVTWTPKIERNYDGFLCRLPVHFRRFDLLGIQYHRSPPGKPSG